MKKERFEARCISSLAKVFPDERLTDAPKNEGSSLQNEMYSFQVAYRNNGAYMKDIRVGIESEISKYIKIKMVGLVPSELPCHDDHDKNILRSTPGLYPDPLFSIEEDGVVGFPGQWRSLWISVDVDRTISAGTYSIKIIFETNKGEQLVEENFELEVIPIALPEQQLIHTEWLHTDCLAVQYRVDVFSERHWQLIDKYVQTAVEHGINMIYTPLFTPPLDTEIGKERPTVQLVEVEKSEGKYFFHFHKLKRWIELCLSKGVKYIEFSHLFTQWGAKYAPKIIVNEMGEDKKLFGWETDASGEAYQDFLTQFLPELVTFIRRYSLDKQVYFHVSDEPRLEHFNSYKKASETITPYLSEFPIMDALSNFQFYEKGLVKKPIPANDHIDPFLESNVPNLWTYYCSLQYRDVSNRFFNFPSARNRIIGMQLYKYGIEGFLHWGYNFWFSRLSKKQIEPFQNTDANYGFPSGDAFLVYPGEDGPIESIRLKVFHEALQDMRALQLLESKIGRKEVIALLENSLEQALTFKEYPIDCQWLIDKREDVNKLIKETFV